MTILAVGTMSPEWQALFFGLAIVCFALAVLTGGLIIQREGEGRVHWTTVSWLPLGLLFFAIPFFWNQLAAA